MANKEEKVVSATKKATAKKKQGPSKVLAAKKKTATPKKKPAAAPNKTASSPKATAQAQAGLMRKDEKLLRLTLVRSLNGRKKAHKDCIRGLGLRKMHQTVEVRATACNKGMISHASYLLEVEEVS